MNDTELLDLILDRLDNYGNRSHQILAVGKPGMSGNDVDEFIDFIKKERANEQIEVALNEKIRKEVEKQLRCKK